MSVYLVERDIPGVTLDQLAAAQKAAIDTSNRFSAEGTPVRYIRTAYVPGEHRVMCLFEAQSAESVERVNTAAGIPFNRVVEAMDLSPSQPGGEAN